MPCDGVVLGVTIFAAVALGAAAVGLVVNAIHSSGPLRFGYAVAAVAAGGVLLVCWALAPTGLRIEARDLVIERPVLPVVLPLADLRDVRPAGRWPRLTVRVGNGGLFAVHGWFWNRERGWFRVYGRRVRGAVVVELVGRRPVVVMPDDVDGFVAALRTRLSTGAH